MRRVERARAVDANYRACVAFFWVYTRASGLSTPTYLSASICPETAASSKKRVPVLLSAAATRTGHRAEYRSEVQRTWMADHGRACLLWPQRADLAECRFHLVDHEIDHVEGTLRAERAETPQKGLAGERSIGPERDCPHHVEPRAHAAVEHQGHPAADGPSNGRKHVDGRRQSFDLASAVVRHHDAINSERHASFRIGRVKDALDHQRSLPAIAITGDLVPSEGAAHFTPHEGCDLIHVCGVGGVGLEIAEARLPVFPQRSEIAGRGQNAGEHAQIRPERRCDAGRNLARARGAHRYIGGENQDMHTSGLGAADKIEADGVLVAAVAIELEPEHVGRDLGCALDRHAADQPERIWHTRALRRGGEILVGARPDDGGTSRGSDADRRGVMPAEQVDTDRR